MLLWKVLTVQLNPVRIRKSQKRFGVKIILGKHNRKKEAEIVVPAGTKLNIGRVEEQSDGRKTLTGNADQVLLPQNWKPRLGK